MIDKIISYFSPKAGYERSKYRAAQTILKRKYEGASKGRRTKGWITNGNDANEEIATGLIPLRNRSRDLIRNNPHARAAQDVVTTSVVGDGISLRIDSVESKETKKLYNSFLDWAETFEIDENGLMNFYGLQELVMNSVFESGEVFVRRVYQKSSDYETVPLKIQILESDFLDHGKNEELDNGGKIIQGKEYDKRGRVVAYWMFPNHPGSRTGSFISQRIPARDIAHVYSIRRAGQARGIPWLSNVVIALRDLDLYQDAELVKQKIASCFAGFIHDISVDGSTEEEIESTIGSHIEPGALEVLPQHKTITFPNPPQVGSYTDFTRTNLRRISSGIGPTYEALTSDYSSTNFSASRMAERVFNKKVNSWQQNMIIPMFCDAVWAWFMEAAMIQGISSNKYKAKWVPPKRELLDPKSDNEASLASVRGGFSTWADEVAARGKDPDAHLAEIKEWNKKLDDAGVVLDIDPRKINKSGMFQLIPGGKQGDPNNEL